MQLRIQTQCALRSTILLASTAVAVCMAFGPTAFAAKPHGELLPIEIGTPERIEVFPQNVALRGSRGRMQLVVTGIYADGRIQDLTRVAEFVSDNPAVVDVTNTVALPKGDGSATIRVRAGQRETSATVDVNQYAQPQPVSFHFEALAALSKQSCNSGACHGSPSGKGGFRLSLRAFDPVLDELTLTREEFGRRTNPTDPESSLLLLKPTMKVPHGGGLRMTRHDPSFSILRQWISEGNRVDPPDAPRCVKVQVYPPSGRGLEFPAHTQQLSVLAHFSDGSIQDVTPLAIFSSSDEEVAEVTSDGLVIGHDRGEAAIAVRYLEHIESCFMSFVKEIPGYVWTNPPVNNYVDEHVHAKLQKLRYLPSDLCTDDEFLRRVYLDVIGILPTVEESKAFLADTAADKRSRVIDQLLDRPEYAKFWALKWGDVLRMTVGQVGNDGVYKYHRWVERAIRDNMPYDQFARDLLTSTGSTLANPPANFFRTSADANDTVETVAQVFLGARLQCAKCHNHPFERWTQDNYYGMAAFFNRVQRKPSPRPGEMVIWMARGGEVVQPRTGRQMKPWLPVRGEIEPGSLDDRRDAFVEWLTSADNPFFARIEVNRMWSHVFGRGIVDPPDDFRDSNPPANAELLDSLATDFVTSGFNRKHVLRVILNSRTYQASFRPNEWNQTDEKYFSHQQPRMLSAEQLLDAICQVSDVPEQFASLPAGTRATQLPAPDLVKHEFLKAFGQPERQTVCACERTNESNLGMAIQFFNGPLIYEKLHNAANRFRRLATEGRNDNEIVTELYLAALNRYPASEELDASLKHVQAKQQELIQEGAQLQTQLAQLQVQVTQLRSTVRERLRDAKLASLPEAIREDVRQAIVSAPDGRTEVQRYLAEKFGAAVDVPEADIDPALNEQEKQSLEGLQKQIAELGPRVPGPDTYRNVALEDICWALLNTNEFLFQH